MSCNSWQSTASMTEKSFITKVTVHQTLTVFFFMQKYKILIFSSPLIRRGVSGEKPVLTRKDHTGLKLSELNPHPDS